MAATRFPNSPRRRRAGQNRERQVGRDGRSLWLLMALVFTSTLLWLQNGAADGWSGVAESAVERGGDAPLAPASTDQLRARFTLCHSGGGRNCVVDGDTFWFGGEKIRIADIDTPETHPARCAAEAARGEAATLRLYALLNAGAFSLESIDRDTDSYGRQLRIVTRDGTSIGEALVSEGLARWYGGGRQAWC